MQWTHDLSLYRGAELLALEALVWSPRVAMCRSSSLRVRTTPMPRPHDCDEGFSLQDPHVTHIESPSRDACESQLSEASNLEPTLYIFSTRCSPPEAKPLPVAATFLRLRSYTPATTTNLIRANNAMRAWQLGWCSARSKPSCVCCLGLLPVNCSATFIRCLNSVSATQPPNQYCPILLRAPCDSGSCKCDHWDHSSSLSTL